MCLYVAAFAIPLKIYNMTVLTFDPPFGVRGWSKILITVMLIYRHWVIIAYGEKLSDTCTLWGNVKFITQKTI